MNMNIIHIFYAFKKALYYIIRSLTKHFDQLHNLLSFLPNQFSVIGISETKLNSFSSSNIDLPNYNFLRKDSPTQAGGVGIYVHNCLSYLLRPDLDFVAHGCDTLWIEILLPKKDRNIIFGIVYRHPNSNLTDFKEDLSNILDIITNENKQIIITGDVNIDLIKSESHQFTSDYLDMLYTNFCFPVITQPTRITDHSQTLIDHIYTKCFRQKYIFRNFLI